jgi:hypothetical protein
LRESAKRGEETRVKGAMASGQRKRYKILLKDDRSGNPAVGKVKKEALGDGERCLEGGV